MKHICKKGEFKKGDLVVYCEIDSVIPERPEFEFLRSKNFRIRTIKLRGQISQGIIFPLTISLKHSIFYFFKNILVSIYKNIISFFYIKMIIYTI